jgi:hypothetical protein
MVQSIMRNSQRLHSTARVITLSLMCIALLVGIITTSKAQTFITNGFKQPSFDTGTQNIHQNIYNYSFAKADSLLHNYATKHPKNGWSTLMYTNFYWWQIMTGNQKDLVLRAKFETSINTIITSFSKEKTAALSNENLYVLANAYAFKTRLNLLEGDYIKGLLNLNKSIDFIQKCVGKEEVFEAFSIQTGLLYYFIEYSKIHKPITRPYLATLPAGSMAKGISLLEKGSKSLDNIIATECTYFLSKIYGEVEHNYNKAETYCLTLAKKYPDNIVYALNLFDCYINQGKDTEAQKALIAIHRLSKTIPNLTATQRAHFINEAKKHSEAVYAKKK